MVMALLMADLGLQSRFPLGLLGHDQSSDIQSVTDIQAYLKSLPNDAQHSEKVSEARQPAYN